MDTEKITNEIPIVNKSNNGKYTISTFGILCILFCLSFHIVWTKEDFKIFPKENLSFSNTFIDEDDLEAEIRRYNDASWAEKLVISNSEMFRMLEQHGFIVDSIRNEK